MLPRAPQLFGEGANRVVVDVVEATDECFDGRAHSRNTGADEVEIALQISLFCHRALWISRFANVALELCDELPDGIRPG